MQHDTAGDPMTGLKWTRRTTRKISCQLRFLGVCVSHNTVGRLLKGMGYRLRVNHKKICRQSPKVRDEQFRYIQKQREFFENEGLPIVSVDTKKKEMIGNFKNSGTSWEESPRLVLDHDFRSDAEALAVPYGVMDVRNNRGRVFVGLSHDTSAFAVDALAQWWIHEGRRMHPQADHLLVLADSGGSNGARVRAWKFGLQHRFCNRFGVGVTLCQYPSGASKWNPIEHRLFAQITRNWQGQPLRTLETMLNYIRTTTTSTGLKVRASMTRRSYQKGVKITDEQMAQLNLCLHDILPKWNYTLLPETLN